MLENPAVRALALSLFAGLSTLLGALIVFIRNHKSETVVTASLGFAAGVMISVSFTDLFPIAQEHMQTVFGEKGGIFFSVCFLATGIFLAGCLDKFVPHQEYDPQTGEKPHQNLFRVGVVSMLAIGLHNFPEGIATFAAGYNDSHLGISVALAITLHNIPEGISVAMPIYFATGSRQKALKFTFLSGIAEPVGALLAFLILRPFISDFMLGLLFALVAGIMIYISVEELIPSSRQYGHDRQALIATFLGICLMPLTIMI